MVCVQCGITIEDRTKCLRTPQTKDSNKCAAAMIWTPAPWLGFADDGDDLGIIGTMTFSDVCM